MSQWPSITPGVSNRTFGFRTQSNSIELNRTIKGQDTRCNTARNIARRLESCTMCPPLKLLRTTFRATVAEVESVLLLQHHAQHRMSIKARTHDATLCETFASRSCMQCCRWWTHGETVACDVAEVEADSTSATISRVDTRCNFQVARDAGNVASCVRAFNSMLFGHRTKSNSQKTNANRTKSNVRLSSMRFDLVLSPNDT